MVAENLKATNKTHPKKSSIIKVAGCWDIWEDAEREYLVHWRFMTKHFGVDTLYMTPITGTADKLKGGLDNTETAFIELPTLEAVIKANKKLTPVIVDENGATELSEFKHPKNALYLFGKVGYSPLENLKGKIKSVRIPSWSKDPNVSRGLLHPHQAAAIILYDKMIKLWH
jgi:hypothetical protein